MKCALNILEILILFFIFNENEWNMLSILFDFSIMISACVVFYHFTSSNSIIRLNKKLCNLNRKLEN